MDTPPGHAQTFYPINKLRNVAVKNSHATHVLLIDIDFVPNRGLESAVTDYVDAGFFNIDQKVPNFSSEPTKGRSAIICV